jgi:hypothetical protein
VLATKNPEYPIIPAPVLVFTPLDAAEIFSPLCALHFAADGRYQVHSSKYWFSLAAVHGISWLLLISAGFRLRRAMREEDGTIDTVGATRRKTGAAGEAAPEVVDLARSRAFTLVAWKIGKMPDTVDPVRWLVRRQRGIKTVIWTGALIPMVADCSLLWSLRWFGPGSVIFGLFNNWPMSFALSVIKGSLFGWAASRFFVEGRRTGELEMLLTTPLGATTMIFSQWNQLRRMLFIPVLLLMVPSVIWFCFDFSSHQGMASVGLDYLLWHLLSLLLSCAITVVGTATLIRAELWYGLTARSQAAAIIQIVLVGQGVPVVMSLAAQPLVRLVVFSVGGLPSWLLFLPQIAILSYYLWLIHWARRRLAAELTDPSSTRFNPGQSIAAARAGLASFVGKARHWPPERNAS